MQSSAIHRVPPQTLMEAMERARTLVTPEDLVILKTKSLHEAMWALHLTLGHSLRSELALWSDDADNLFQDISERVPDHPALDADSASGALIAQLWQDVHAH